ncbi:MAG: hypothetical protein AB9842_09100 [Bacteroidales bacterium]
MKLWIRLLLAAVMFGFIAGILVYKLVYNKPHPDYQHEKAAYSVSAKDLFDQFKLNTSEAGLKYNGQIIEVAGTISKIEASDSLFVVAFVFEEGMFGDEGIRISLLPEVMDKADKLSQGAEIKLKGLCTGFNDTDVILEQGSIVE